MDSSDSSAAAASQQPHLPPGFRFHPTDEELVVHYLKKKAASAPIPVSIIADIDLYKFDPWELPDKATFGEHEWYFFSPRDRKYPNGARPNRAATSGYWKATGTDKPVMTGGGTQKVGVKKALVFYGGKPPKGIKTNWIMHEYRLADNKTNSRPPGCGLPNKKASLRLDDWVLCRIYKKNNAQRPMDHDKDDSMDMIGSIPPQFQMGHQNLKLSPLKASNYAAMLESEQHLFDGMLNGDAINGGGSLNHLNPSHSKPQLPMAATAGGSLNGKRSFPNLFWNEDGPATSSSTKRFLGDGSNEETNDQNGSFATLLSQQSVLGSLGDGVIRQSYQLPGLNWN